MDLQQNLKSGYSFTKMRATLNKRHLYRFCVEVNLSVQIKTVFLKRLYEAGLLMTGLFSL